MQMTCEQTDSSLLQEFAARGSQDAFTELVSRHSDWVYSASVRLVRDRELAQDVAQAVFLVLAEKAGKLGAVPLHGWLFKVTRYAAANAIRARSRRDKYERLAAMSTSEVHETDCDEMWKEIAPILDDSLSRLRSRDRDALLMRFYQQKSVAEVASELGVSEGAAKIRIIRAIDKLRAVLRRRGIAVPSDALGAVLLTFTTHPAPATFVAGCTAASASIKATAISKGVSTMLVSAKLKILAVVILLTAIPIGTGAIFLETVDRPLVAPAQTAAPAITAPAAPEAVLDPRVAPFVTDSTDIMIAIDVTKIDIDALAADIRQELAQSQMDAASAAHISGMIQMGVVAGKLWINGFKQAGGKEVFLLSRSDELTLNSGPNATGMQLTATAVFPTNSAAMAQSLAKYVGGRGSTAPKVIGDTVVCEDAASESTEAGDWSDNRSGLAEGLAAGGDAPIRMAVNPKKLKDVITKCLASGQMAANFKGDEWDDVDYASINLVLPPAENPGFLIISHHKDAASAEKARDNATQRIERFKPTDKNSPLAASTSKFIATEKFTVKGSNVVATMDLHAYWDLIFSAVRLATAPAATQTQGHVAN
jgi:RNA polymerase sigma factor (sigma-70 family)